MKTSQTPGEWRVICDVCDVSFLSSDIQKRWDGFLACPQCYDPKPAAYNVLPGVTDEVAVPFSREQAEYSTETVTVDGHTTAASWLNLPSILDPL